MIGLTVISKLKLLAPNHAWDSRNFSGMIVYRGSFLYEGNDLGNEWGGVASTLIASLAHI